MIRRLAATAVAALLSACGSATSSTSRAKYAGPVQKPLWQVDGVMVSGPAPRIHSGVVYARARTFAKPDIELYAFDAANGKQLWKSGFAPGAMLLFAGDSVVVDDAEGAVHLFESKTGNQKASAAYKGAKAGAAAADGVAYLVTGQEAFAVDPASAKEVWRVPAPGCAQAVTAGDHLYLACGSDPKASVLTVDRKSGKIVSKWEGDGAIYDFKADDGHAFVLLTSRTLVAIDAASGSQKWTQPDIEGGPFLTGKDTLTVYAKPAGKDQNLATSGFLFRTVNRDTGAKVAEVTTEWKYPAPTVSDDGASIVSSEKTAHGKMLDEGGNTAPDVWVTVVDLKTGKEAWRSAITAFGELTRPGVEDGLVVVGMKPWDAPRPKPDDPQPAGLIAFRLAQK